MSQRYAYPARFERDADGFLVRFRDFPEALTAGTTRAEAFSEAEDALAAAVHARLAANRTLPPPSPPEPGEEEVPLPEDVAIRAALTAWAAEQGRGAATRLAERLGKSEKVGRRLLDLDHSVRLESLREALAAIGGRAVVEVVWPERLHPSPPDREAA